MKLLLHTQNHEVSETPVLPWLYRHSSRDEDRPEHSVLMVYDSVIYAYTQSAEVYMHIGMHIRRELEATGREMAVLNQSNDKQ